MRILSKQSLSLYRDSGSILIICMWVLVFFSILSVGLFSIISSQIKIVRVVEDRFFSEWLARSAVLHAQALIKSDESDWDSLYELRKEKSKELGINKFVYTFVDEESKININKSSAEVISNLPELNLEVAENIVNSTRRPFSAKEEILSIDGISDEMFAKFKDFITVYGEGKVNINTASPEVLKAKGLDESLINIICDFRKGADAEEATADDGVFDSADTIISTLNTFKVLAADQETAILNGSFMTNSENFCLKVQAMILDRPAMRYDIVIDKNRIKEWREY